MNINKGNKDETTASPEIKPKIDSNVDQQNEGSNEDGVSGYLYDRLQKEVINLRKLCEVRDGTLNAKDEEIKMLMKKVDALTKAIEVESKKIKREAAAREKEAASMKVDDIRKSRHAYSSKAFRCRVTKSA